MSQRPIGLPSPTVEPKQHAEMLRSVKEILEIAQRQRGDPLKSFVRLEELVSLGLADANGNLLASSSSTSSGTTDDSLMSFFLGE